MDWFETAMKIVVVVIGAGVGLGLLRVVLGRPLRGPLGLGAMRLPHRDPATDQELVNLSQTVERLRGEVAELQERLDFAERVLAQQRERQPLPDGGAAAAGRSG